jgi:hypothetical protein
LTLDDAAAAAAVSLLDMSEAELDLLLQDECADWD